MPGNYVINRKKRNSVKATRARKQVSKISHGSSATDVLAIENAKIVSVEQLVQEATERRRETRLLTDKPHEDITRVKLTNAIRPGFMAMAQPTGINKKKVKKMLQRKKLVSRHFMEALEARIGNQ